MSKHKKYSLNDFHLPQIRRYSQKDSKKSSIYSQNHSILSRFEQQLKIQNKKYQTQVKQKRKPYRLKTIDVNEHESYDDLRRQLRSIKEQVNYNMKEYNHKIENKFEQFVLLSALKKDSQPSIVMQPMPMYYPPMYPNHSMLPPQMYSQSMQNYPEQYPNYSYPNLMPPRPKPLPKSKIYSKLTIKKFKRYVYAVVFTIRLRKFVAKVIKHKKEMFNKYLYNTTEFKQEAGQLKRQFIDGMKKILVTLLQREDSEIQLNEGDSQNFKKQKITTTHKLIELLIDCIRKTVESNQFTALVKSIYYFCRHGSYACAEKLLTQEELQNMSISDKHYYLQADKRLQKSQIINFLFMKIIVYNILCQPWKIDPEKFSKDKQTLYENIMIISSILYEILMDIQDDLIVNSPQCYKLNNYQQIKATNIYPAQPLTVKPGEFRKNQIISGLINENIIKNTYNLQKLWVKQKNQLIQIIESVHQKIVNYHKKLIKPFL